MRLHRSAWAQTRRPPGGFARRRPCARTHRREARRRASRVNIVQRSCRHHPEHPCKGQPSASTASARAAPPCPGQRIEDAWADMMSCGVVAIDLICVPRMRASHHTRLHDKRMSSASCHPHDEAFASHRFMTSRRAGHPQIYGLRVETCNAVRYRRDESHRMRNQCMTMSSLDAALRSAC